MIRVIIPIFILVFSYSSLVSQGGSNYSIFGLGDLEYSKGAKYEGMGGVSIAVPSKTGINQVNPAAWGFNEDTRFQLGYKFNQSLVSDGTSDLLQNNGGIDAIQAMFSIDTSNKFSIAFGLIPYSNVSAFVATPIDIIKNEQRVTGKTLHTSSGGLNRGYIGASIQIIDGVQLGANYSILFGNIKNETNSIFNESNALTSNNFRRESFFGTNWKLGTIVTPMENFRIGGFYESEASLDIDRDLIYDFNANLDTILSISANTFLPSSFGIGASYDLSKFRLALDYKAQNFTGFDFTRSNKIQFINSQTIALGFEILGNRNSLYSQFDRMNYRLGAYFTDLYYTIDNNPIQEYAITGGLTSPLKGSAEVDVAIAVGIRGTTNNNLIRELFARMSFNVSIGETWFQPFNR